MNKSPPESFSGGLFFGKSAGKWPLFEKSGAKTFADLGLWRRNQHGPAGKFELCEKCSGRMNPLVLARASMVGRRPNHGEGDLDDANIVHHRSRRNRASARWGGQ